MKQRESDGTTWVTVVNEKSHATAEVPKKALKVYAERGWKPVKDDDELKQISEKRAEYLNRRRGGHQPEKPAEQPQPSGSSVRR